MRKEPVGGTGTKRTEEKIHQKSYNSRTKTRPDGWLKVLQGRLNFNIWLFLPMTRRLKIVTRWVFDLLYFSWFRHVFRQLVDK